MSAAPAFAQYTQPSSTPTVESSIDRSPTTEASVLGSTVTRGGLSVTGADVLLLGLIGLGTLGTGSALVVAGRRRREA